MMNLIDKDKVLYMLSGRIADSVEIADGANEETDKETKEKYLEAANRYTFIYKFISQIPAAEAEPVKRGKWIPWRYHDGFRCEICGEPVYNRHNYCANCGARMDGEEE